MIDQYGFSNTWCRSLENREPDVSLMQNFNDPLNVQVLLRFWNKTYIIYNPWTPYRCYCYEERSRCTVGQTKCIIVSHWHDAANVSADIIDLKMYLIQGYFTTWPLRVSIGKEETQKKWI